MLQIFSNRTQNAFPYSLHPLFRGVERSCKCYELSHKLRCHIEFRDIKFKLGFYEIYMNISLRK